MNDEHPTNSNRTDPWESEMTREFDQRVRDLHEAPLTLDQVKGKAMTIRRNRRIAVAGGVLAAAAVIVPVAVVAGNGLGRSDGSPDIATTVPSPTQATDPNQPTLTEPPRAGLGVSYLERSTWHRADGSSVELDEAYVSGVELGDQLVATSNDDGQLTVDVIDADGSVMESVDVLSFPVADPNHTVVAYVDADGTLVERQTASGGSIDDGFVDGDSVGAVTGPGEVVVNHGDGSPPELVDHTGRREEAIPGAKAIKVNDVSPDGLVAAQTSNSDSGSCSAVYDPETAANVFDTCDATLFAFSPDAGHITCSHAYLDGIGLGYVTILDATDGAELARFTPKEGFVRESVWEDEDHVLVNTYEQGEWRIYRLGVDGTTAQVLSSGEGDDMTPAFTLLGGS